MNREKIVTGLWAAGLSFGLSFGAVACMVTAFDMEISLAATAGFLLLASALCALCFSLPLGAAPLSVAALTLWRLWRSGALASAAEAILNRLSRQYSRAYGWEIIRWSLRTAPEMEPDLLPALCILGAVVALLTAWSVCRKKPALPGILISVVMLATCVVVTDTVPAAIWLYLYLLSVAVLLVTGTVRRGTAQDANRLSVVAAPAAALALLVIFLLNPTQNYKGRDLAADMTESLRRVPVLDMLLDRMGLQEEGVSVSAGNGVDLTTVGQRGNSDAKVMEILVSGSGTSTVYLRSMAYDLYDGKTWRSSGYVMKGLKWPTDLRDGRTIQIKTNFAHQMLYMPYYVQSVDLSGTATGIENSNKLREYSFSYNSMPDKRYFEAQYPDNYLAGIPDEERGYMLLGIQMDNSVRRWAEPLSLRITAMADTDNVYRAAQAIGDYVRNSATYDLNTSRMPTREKDFARWFLEDSDTGYCVHFATAATVLLQAEKIPARYVTGYVVQAQTGVPTIVTADMAHAWTEYYLPGFGWTVLEATPPDFISQPLETQPEQETTDAAPEQTDPETTAPAADAPQTQQPEEEKKQFPWELLWIIVIPAGIIGLAEGQYRLRRRLYRKRYDRSTENEKAILCWQKLVKLAQLAGMTPDKTAYALAQKAAFSQHCLTEQELQQLENAVDDACKALAQKPFTLRLFSRLIYAL